MKRPFERLFCSGILVALSACSAQSAGGRDGEQKARASAAAPAAATQQANIPGEPVSAVAPDLPAGAYTIDPGHTSLLFRVNHLGFSIYTARFKKVDAQLQFDPKNLAASSLTATVDARSIETDYPDPALDFNAQLQSAEWLNTTQHPQMTFRSKSIELTGANTMRVNGDFTLRGVTRPLTLDVKFNGGYSGHPLDPRARIGFSASGSLRRSEFGISTGIPEPGSFLGVGDNVQIVIETEFSGPPRASG